jgi:hypothetical protein
MGREGMIIEQKGPPGPGGWGFVLIGGGVAIALTLVGVAVYSLAQWLGIALIVLASGQASASFLCGVANVVWAIGRARAEMDRARLAGLVNLRLAGGRDRARLGPRTREDIEELFD